ncbi:SusE domain-containing protein [Hymenobacter pini]|uniref:SusE domain-containing protein n=1 Tax=Hymenobacter pini TaxID=2880879 RepID=UPI001CF2AF4A|nr:SusE domain-containing protein [Hymenobacter pini]MCA8829642.1 SusE domain-containing protein [Hymenobacter pini]
MNNLFTKLAGLGLATTVLLASCEKEEDKITIAPASASGLTASTATTVLLQANANQNAVTYTWAPTSYGYQAAVSYTLQFDKKGGTFASPIEVEAGTATSKTLTNAELNNVLLKLKMQPGSAGQVDVRVKSSVGKPVNAAYSAATTLTATPYSEFVTYPQIYVPGSYQGWAPDKAPFLASMNSNQKYEGYVNFTDASTMFKFTPARNWDNDFGDDGSKTGKLKAKGSDISVTGPGYYRFNVDLNSSAMTYTYTKTAWAVIGSATPGGWNTETPLVYDATKGTWSVTLPLVAGDFKFRANNAWDIDMGDNEPDGKPDYKGKDIKGPGAGTYTITLDLSKGEGNYSYTVNK